MYYLYQFIKLGKYIGVIAWIMTFFSENIIFKLLCLFGLFIIVELAIAFPILKCSFLQIAGIRKISKQYADNPPSILNYKNEIEYTLPFEGKWTAINGCYTEKFSHSWGIPTQRYAYDFIILDDNGRSHENEYNKCENYFCYHKNIIAPADGCIIEVNNSARDSIIFKKEKFWARSSHIAGNYIIIKHSESEYSLLAHLKKDSITVKAGDFVARGDIIATCGNTGNSTEPHLHFQLQNGPSFYDSAGLPIKFHCFTLSEIPNYQNYDTRPHMPKEEVLDGYITRGFNVSNYYTVDTKKCGHLK